MTHVPILPVVSFPLESKQPKHCTFSSVRSMSSSVQLVIVELAISRDVSAWLLRVEVSSSLLRGRIILAISMYKFIVFKHCFQPFEIKLDMFYILYNSLTVWDKIL